ncbi:MAG: hypothetical protein M3067_11285 [Chloroflexota bacterium]|nr:hypothetical protein [Chloroflexota bacterium]
MRDLEQLEGMEREKRQLPPDDPRLVQIAADVETIALRVLGSTVRQRELAEDASELTGAGEPRATAESIADVPREIHVILAEWRDAERRATEARPASAEGAAAAAEVDRLRAEYRTAHEDAIRRRNA